MFNTKEEKKWLEAFQKTLLLDNANEENRNPKYYSIMDYSMVETTNNNRWDDLKVYNHDYTDYQTAEEVLAEMDLCEIEELYDSGYSGLKRNLNGEFEISSKEEFLEEVSFNKDNLELVYLKETATIARNCCFLTRAAAEKHLKENYYHYDDEAHTYAMTAWRSPEMEHLMMLLENIDFGKSEIVFKNIK